MHVQDPDGFRIRESSAGKKVFRVALVSIGPHHEWSADGHDKLSKLGFPIWGVRDKWSGKWLGLWVVPNNRLKVAIGYLYLSLVKKLGGESSVVWQEQTLNDLTHSTRNAHAKYNGLWKRDDINVRACKRLEVRGISSLITSILTAR